MEPGQSPDEDLITRVAALKEAGASDEKIASFVRDYRMHHLVNAPSAAPADATHALGRETAARAQADATTATKEGLKGTAANFAQDATLGLAGLVSPELRTYANNATPIAQLLGGLAGSAVPYGPISKLIGGGGAVARAIKGGLAAGAIRGVTAGNRADPGQGLAEGVTAATDPMTLLTGAAANVLFPSSSPPPEFMGKVEDAVNSLPPVDRWRRRYERLRRMRSSGGAPTAPSPVDVPAPVEVPAQPPAAMPSPAPEASPVTMSPAEQAKRLQAILTDLSNVKRGNIEAAVARLSDEDRALLQGAWGKSARVPGPPIKTLPIGENFMVDPSKPARVAIDPPTDMVTPKSVVSPGAAAKNLGHETLNKVDQAISDKATNIALYLKSLGAGPTELDQVLADPALTRQLLDEAHRWGATQGHPIPKTGYAKLDLGSDTHKLIRSFLERSQP